MSAGQGGSAGTAGASGTAGKGGGDPCAGKSCDDGVACTLDTCQGGECVHKVDATACPAGQFCTVEKGCVGAPACATDQQCAEAWKGDPCKANPRCDAASSVCVFDPLDKDKDGHPPIVCGGDDCDDADAGRYPGKKEECDQRDDDCDGDLDKRAVCFGFVGDPDLDPVYFCSSGACQCRPEHLCGEDCAFNKDENPMHCGACFHACAPGESCKGGKCVCEADLQNDRNNCGACAKACGPGDGCKAGQCACEAGLQAECGKAVWTNETVSLCPIGYTHPSADLAWLTTAVTDGGGNSVCPDDGKNAAPGPWFNHTFSFGCAGALRLCVTLKAGAYKAATDQDCTVGQWCADADYSVPGATQGITPLPGWKIDMATAAPGVKACALKALNESGYLEFTVERECPGTRQLAHRVGFCFSNAPECSGVSIPEDSADFCKNFQDDDGDGAIDCADPDCCNLVDCKTFDPASFCAQQN